MRGCTRAGSYTGGFVARTAADLMHCFAPSKFISQDNSVRMRREISSCAMYARLHPSWFVHRRICCAYCFRSEALFRAQQIHQPGQLGENATRDFILRHVCEVAPELVRTPADLLRVLLQIGSTVSRPANSSARTTR